MGVNSGTGTAHPSEAPEVTPSFSGVALFDLDANLFSSKNICKSMH
jgi:hypothetical protein